MVLKTKVPIHEGDFKIATKFAWFPTWVGDKKIWLQKYQYFYEYRKRERTIFLDGRPFTFECCDWDLIDKKILG